MLNVLNEVKSKLPQLLLEKAQKGEINTLYVDYHKPFVSRIWFQLDEINRVFLHGIQPCNSDIEALWHFHPWESAIEIISGKYEMGIGHSEKNIIPSADCKIILAVDCPYEMINPNGWHYVAPTEKPSYSLMVTGKLFPRREMHIKPEKEFRKLTKTEILDILMNFSAAHDLYQDIEVFEIADLIIGK